jgi:hypothetical protein
MQVACLLWQRVYSEKFPSRRSFSGGLPQGVFFTLEIDYANINSVPINKRKIEEQRRHKMAWQCKIGIHDYEWSYDYPYSSCDQTGSCRRDGCDQSKTRVHHRFGDWEYESYDSCKLVKRCQCSDIIEGSTKHIWRSWEYQSSTDCEKRRYCERNTDHFEDQAPSHQWGEPTYVSEGSCVRVRVCERNPQHTKTSTDHMWGPPVLSEDCNLFSRCTRCPDGVNYVGTRHDFLPPERVKIETDSTSKVILVRLCRNCSHSERDEIS